MNLDHVDYFGMALELDQIAPVQPTKFALKAVENASRWLKQIAISKGNELAQQEWQTMVDRSVDRIRRGEA